MPDTITHCQEDRMTMADMTGAPASFLAEFQRLHREKRTGLLFISGFKRVIQLNLEGGEIVYLACQDKRGVDVLPLLKEIDNEKLRFVEGGIPALRTPAPPTSEILDYLDAGQSLATPAPAPIALLLDLPRSQRHDQRRSVGAPAPIP
jgi:hypothetical protein